MPALGSVAVVPGCGITAALGGGDVWPFERDTEPAVLSLYAREGSLCTGTIGVFPLPLWFTASPNQG